MKLSSYCSRNRIRQRGSVLIVALLLSAVIAISLGSYLALSSTSLRLANRTFYNNAAINLAETGIEEALWCFNQVAGGTPLNSAWSGWAITATTGGDGTATRTFTNFKFAGTTTGSVKVYVDSYNPSGSTQPRIVALASIAIPKSRPVVKEIEVKLSRRTYFAMGMVARESITFAGNNAYVDSWNSKRNNDGSLRASPIAYVYDVPHIVSHDKGSIGSVSVNSTITVVNADIYGFAAVGGNSTSAISVGPQGRVGTWTAPNAYKDPSRVATDFTANLEIKETPTISGSPLTSFGATLGSNNTTTSYRSTIGIQNDLTINGNVTLVIDVPAGQPAIDLQGNKQLTISAGSSLIVYSPGNVDAQGNAMINNSNIQPLTFQFYGTSTSTTQTVDIGGNGTFKGVIFAPNANIKIHGNGDVEGSVVGNKITLTGNAKFHYDESLAEFGDNNPYGVDNWRELITATERATYTSQMNSF